MSETIVAAPSGPAVRTIVGLMAVLALAAMDGTVLGTAMPTVVATIGGMALYPWAFASFMLTSTVSMPFYGRFADVLGVRRCMSAAVLIFLAGSVACALATTMPVLIACRAVQGLGAGGVMTLVSVCFGLLFAPEVRGRAQSLLSLVWGVSTLLGPLAGGLMVSYMPWPAIFWINLPVGAVALLLIGSGMPERLGPPRPVVFPVGQALVLTGGLLAIMWASTSGGGLPLGLAGVLALVGFVFWQAHTEHPIVPLAPFQNRLYAVSAVIGFVSFVAMFGTMTYLPLWVQGVLGRSPAEAGAIVTPMMVGWPIAGAATGFAVNRLGFRTPAVIGASLLMGGLGLMVATDWKHVIPVLAAVSLAVGIGQGMVNSTTTIAGQVSLPRTAMGSGSATQSLMRQLGGAMGASVLGGLQLTVLANELARRGINLPADQVGAMLWPGAPAIAGVPLDAVRAALAVSLESVFQTAAALAVLVWLLSIAVPPLKPAEAAAKVVE